MSQIVEIERMFDELHEGARSSLLSGEYVGVDLSQTVECHFNFEPRLRYIGHIVSFNRLLNDYTNFTFKIILIKKGCIDVYFYAENFSLNQKNTVRRQILKLIKEFDIQTEFNITQCTIFQSHRYVYGRSVDNEGH